MGTCHLLHISSKKKNGYINDLFIHHLFSNIFEDPQFFVTVSISGEKCIDAKWTVGQIDCWIALHCIVLDAATTYNVDYWSLPALNANL